MNAWMPQMVTVPAVTDFAYRGRYYRRGERVTMRPIDAAIHARQGHVSLARTYDTTHLTAETPAKKGRTRRRYRRRDLTAEAAE